MKNNKEFNSMEIYTKTENYPQQERYCFILKMFAKSNNFAKQKYN